MLQYSTIKARLYPDGTQAELFENTFGCCRYIWNRMLADQQRFYLETDKHFIPTPETTIGLKYSMGHFCVADDGDMADPPHWPGSGLSWNRNKIQAPIAMRRLLDQMDSGNDHVKDLRRSWTFCSCLSLRPTRRSALQNKIGFIRFREPAEIYSAALHALSYEDDGIKQAEISYRIFQVRGTSIRRKY